MQIQHIKLISPGIIEIAFSYSGGCEEHEFNLYSSGGMIKTQPPKISLYLVDHQENDPCRQLLTATKRFDISDALPEDHKKAILLVNNNFEYQIENY